MALKAVRNSIAPQTQDIQVKAQVVIPPVKEETPVEQQPQAPVTNTLSVVKPSLPVKPGSSAEMNAGVLDNIDDVDDMGCFIKVDGESFVIPDGSDNGLRTREIQSIISYGKKFYQWVDETDPENKVFHNEDIKLNENYKMKFELRFMLDLSAEDTEGEPKEFTLTLSPTSAFNFISYFQKLKKLGFGVGNVVTRFTISRQTRTGTKDKYSRVEFEGFRTTDGEKIYGTV